MKNIVACTLFFGAILLSSIVTAADSKGDYAIVGHGGNSCEQFTSAVDNGKNQKDGSDLTPYSYYAAGWVSATNYHLEDTYNILGDMPSEGVLAFLDKYCRVNPQKTFTGALIELEKNKYPTRAK